RACRSRRRKGKSTCRRYGAPNDADASLGAPRRPDRCDRVANSCGREPNSERVDLDEQFAPLVGAEERGGAAVGDGDRDVAVGVLVEDQLPARRVREGAGGDRVVAVALDRQLDPLPGYDRGRVEMLARQVQRDVAEAVD